ncbi:branched-chain amino acid ABC transporter permease [Micromonospora sp. PSH03]|uniref:Branched-chain amino acid ABC transporter permease n=4 Tax=Micromonospora TaxID=1873 RepID=A0A3N9Y1N9_9ACTN|nr:MULTISPECIES: branched-chain amino acid ABC transporter permease [Micromonospora]WTI05651.1 branched-chain amino acid ABC transporter permease [Micromonospora sp. NBC_00821]KAB1928687.1 branched-chain amino acid ABC transporter permease [Micromonospora noduli]MBG6065243.1 branched-chain amino acid transport system permease protein [Micromonospora ureilytica]MBQ0994151.1 branched-chain amino acid ABC transporter permease [Micromonospora sp. H61]MBQ1020167.1 branched-chain amino acid ABC tran
MDRFVFLTVDGLSRGAVYAAFALALVLIWRAARVVNFAQGAMAVAAAYVAYTVSTATGSYWLGFVVAIVAGLLLGALVDRVVMRHVDHASPLNPVIVALGLVLLIQAVLGMVYGSEFRPAEAPFSRSALTVGGVAVLSPYDLFVFATIGVVVSGLAWMFARTPVGLRMRAAAFAPEVSRLLGVNVGGMLTLGWALASGVGALAAMLVLPTELGLHPHAMDLVFVSAFTAAVVGGLDSPPGAVVGGLVVGLLLSYVSGYAGSDLTPLAVLVLLLAVLLVRPGGLFAPVAARRV